MIAVKRKIMNVRGCLLFILTKHSARPACHLTRKKLIDKARPLTIVCRWTPGLIYSIGWGNILPFIQQIDGFNPFQVRGQIVTYPGKRPSSLRVDQLDRYNRAPGEGQPVLPVDERYPLIVHFGVRPASLSYAGDPTYVNRLNSFYEIMVDKNARPHLQ